MVTGKRPGLHTAGHFIDMQPSSPGIQSEQSAEAPMPTPTARPTLAAHPKVPLFSDLVQPHSWKSVNDEPDLNQTNGIVRGAVAYEEMITAAVQAQILPALDVKTISANDVRAAEDHILAGDVAFCDASIVRSATEAVSKTRCVVTLFNYVDPPLQRLRNWHDPRDEITFDPHTELGKVLKSRRNSAFTAASRSELRDRQVMAYMERSTGLNRQEDQLILHGPMLPLELFAQGDNPDVVAASIHLAWKMLYDPGLLSIVSETARGDLLAIGMALDPYQYVLIDDYKGYFRTIAGRRYESAKWKQVGKDLARLAAVAGPALLVRVLRTEATAPPRVFHVHHKRCHENAVIAMAACAMEPQRCFPEGTDICDQLSGSYCRQSEVDHEMALAHLEAGAPFSYLSERATRHQMKGEL